MKLCTVVLVILAVILTVDVLGTCEGWWGSSRSSSSKSSSGSSSEYSSTNTERGKTIKAKSKTVHVGKTGIRDRDETGHRTGLGTLARKALKEPVKTLKAAMEFVKVREGNVKQENLAELKDANKEATKKSDAETTAALSALLGEQSKRFRVRNHPDGSWRVGDTGTEEETAATMNANKRGREAAQAGQNPSSG